MKIIIIIINIKSKEDLKTNKIADQSVVILEGVFLPQKIRVSILNFCFRSFFMKGGRFHGVWAILVKFFPPGCTAVNIFPPSSKAVRPSVCIVLRLMAVK